MREMLSGISNVSLVEPLDYLSLVHLLKRCELVLTDSGGLQRGGARAGRAGASAAGDDGAAGRS